MKKINKNSKKYLALLIFTYSVMGIIIYPILDIIYSKLITETEFVYSVYNDITKPIIMGVIMGTCLWFAEKKN